MEKPKNEAMYKELKKLLKKHPDLLWLSEGQSKLTPVTFLSVRKHKWNWQEETNAESKARLEALKADNDHSEGAVKLVNLLNAQDNIVTFKRPNGNPSEYDLYVMVNFSWRYCGFKVTLTES